MSDISVQAVAGDSLEECSEFAETSVDVRFATLEARDLLSQPSSVRD
jgi:hypothetical protein